MRRIEQVSELLKEKLAFLISREVPLNNGLITVSHVKVSPDLKYAKISVSILPDNSAGTALKSLRSHNSMFNNILKKELKMRQVPKFNWVIDTTEKEAAIMEQAISNALKEDKELEDE